MEVCLTQLLRDSKAQVAPAGPSDLLTGTPVIGFPPFLILSSSTGAAAEREPGTYKEELNHLVSG